MDTISPPAGLDAQAAFVWAWALQFLPHLGAALLIAALGLVAAIWASRGIARLAENAFATDPTLAKPIAAVARYTILIFVLIATLNQLGVQTATVLASVGAAGLAIGLALQGTLSNIAAGIMLLWLRPFRVGDYVETATASGTVREINLFATNLETFDGIYRFVPNSEIWNKQLVNQTRNPARLFNVVIGIALGDDEGKARRLIAETLASEPGVLPAPAPEVFVDTMADNFTYIAARAWLPTPGYWSRHRTLVAHLKRALDGAGIAVQRISHPAPDVGDQRLIVAAGGNRAFRRLGHARERTGTDPH